MTYLIQSDTRVESIDIVRTNSDDVYALARHGEILRADGSMDRFALSSSKDGPRRLAVGNDVYEHMMVEPGDPPLVLGPYCHVTDVVTVTRERYGNIILEAEKKAGVEDEETRDKKRDTVTKPFLASLLRNEIDAAKGRLGDKS